MTAAALRGAAEEAVAQKKDIQHGPDCYPAPPADDGNIAVVPSISSGKKGAEQDGQDQRGRSQKTDDCSEESSCPPSKRQNTMVSA